jgi:CBS domain-containing protein
MPELTVRDIMVPDVPVASPATRIAELARLLVEHDLPGVPIVDGGELVGIVTEADLIQREAEIDMPKLATFFDAVLVADAGTSFEEELRRVTATTAGELMTSPVISIRAEATPSQLATLILRDRVNPVPVVDAQRRIIGLATRRRLVEMIAELEQGLDGVLSEA